MICRFGLYLSWVSLAFFLNNDALAQLSRPGRPFPSGYPVSSVIPVYFVDSEIPTEKALTDPDSLLLKPATSGLYIPIEYHPHSSGAWDTASDGTKIWRIGFTHKDAVLMNIIFSPYRLKEGVRLYLFDPAQENVIGALSDLNNKPFGQLATANIPGNTIIIEMHIPAYLDEYGELGIAGLGCDFTGKAPEFKKDEWFGISGPCNIDISCENDHLISRLKNSVVRIVFNGHERCTGTLVNTSDNNGVYYVLTAGHCFKEEDEANSAVFYFQYESPYCNGPDGNTAQSLSGATIRARSDKIDFALLELLEPVPFTYHPYYAGWDYTDAAPGSGITIHHPLGDVKKIAFEEHPLTISSFGSLYNDNTHWLVSHWESGTTEAGSSGAPIFDESGKIKGTLTGGLAKCDNPVKDYFQMFSHSWKDFFRPEEQLAIWLDPLKSSNGSLEGNDPFEEFWLTGDTLSNISENEELSVESGGLEWGSYSGHNSLHTKAFAERFETSSKIISGINLFVKDNYISRTQRYLNLIIWSGSTVPEEIIYRKSVPLDNLIPHENNFIEFDTIVSPGPIFFAGFELFYPATQDTFSVYMAENRGIDGENTAYVSEGLQWSALNDYSGGTVNSSFAIFPVVYGSIPAVPGEQENYVSVYPNPVLDQVRLIFRQMDEEPVKITVFNIQGQIIIDQEYGPFQHIIPLDLKRFSPGLYIIRVKQGDRLNNLKVSIVK
jgi:lysyl endopeptidase